MTKLDWRKAKIANTSEPARKERRTDKAADALIDRGATQDDAMSEKSCPTCNRRFVSRSARDMHYSATHGNPEWSASKRHADKIAKAERKIPVCPMCGKRAKVTETRYGLRAACCGLHSWKLKPLASQETHDARMATHAAFDPLWKSGGMTRGDAYMRLAGAMGMTPAECHISEMTAEQALRAAEIALSGALSVVREIAA